MKQLCLGLTLCALTHLLTPRVMSADEGQWHRLFNGRDLSGWHAVPASTAGDWSVKDGAIVGSGSEDRLSYLVWNNDELADFEFTLRYRLHGRGNSGIEIRAVRDPSERRPFIGYHADLGHVGIGPHILGAWDFHFAGREEPACRRGTRLTIAADGTFEREKDLKSLTPFSDPPGGMEPRANCGAREPLRILLKWKTLRRVLRSSHGFHLSSRINRIADP